MPAFNSVGLCALVRRCVLPFRLSRHIHTNLAKLLLLIGIMRVQFPLSYTRLRIPLETENRSVWRFYWLVVMSVPVMPLVKAQLCLGLLMPPLG